MAGIVMWQSMPKYFVDEVKGQNIVASAELSHHLKKVLRLRVGDELVVCDGNEIDYICIIESLDPLLLRLEREEVCPTEPSCKITLYQAMPKSDKMEWIVQKSVEIGVYAIVPIITERTVAKKARLERYQKIAESAAGQSMRGIIPKVHPEISLEEAIKRSKAYQIAAHVPDKSQTVKIQTIKMQTIKSALMNNDFNNNFDEIGLWIGPEGGFSQSEIEKMKMAAFNLVSLGPRILRTETAALTALAQIIMVTEL